MKYLLIITCTAALSGCTAIDTRVVIDAPASRVRAIVGDYGAYPSWNPFVVKVEGEMSAGRDVRVTVHPVGQALVTGTGHVLAADPDRIAWSGRLGFPGVFSGVHTFLIEADGPSRTIFSNNEKMRGLSVLFYDFEPTKAAFVAMNQALKQRAEARCNRGTDRHSDSATCCELRVSRRRTSLGQATPPLGLVTSSVRPAEISLPGSLLHHVRSASCDFASPRGTRLDRATGVSLRFDTRRQHPDVPRAAAAEECSRLRERKLILLSRLLNLGGVSCANVKSQFVVAAVRLAAPLIGDCAPTNTPGASMAPGPGNPPGQVPAG